jgi:hypothetical protein
VNGVVQNMSEFQKAFSCSVGKAMVAAPAYYIWQTSDRPYLIALKRY